MRPHYFSNFQLILIALFSALIVVAKIALKTPLQMPGHSGLFWMAILITGAGVVDKRGAASLMGVTSGLLAAFLGVGDMGALNTVVSYTASGIVTDLTLMLLGHPENPLVGTFAGVFGNLGKFVVKWVFGLLSGAPLGFVALGMAYSLLTYIIFGALGGLLGSLTLIALHRAGFFAYIQEKK